MSLVNLEDFDDASLMAYLKERKKRKIAEVVESSSEESFNGEDELQTIDVA